jgi:hypothetical protein
MFDVVDHLDELRSWPTDRLVARRHEVVRAKRRLEIEELDILRVLDERGRVDPTVGDQGESPSTLRDKLETARVLESLPEIAAVAYEGDLSAEQLSSVAKLADEASDVEWARRAPRVAPGELARLARNASKPSTEDSRARYAARSLRMWWTPRQRDAAPPRATARRDGRHPGSDDPAAHRADEAGQRAGVGQLRTSRRRRAPSTV